MRRLCVLPCFIGLFAASPVFAAGLNPPEVKDAAPEARGNIHAVVFQQVVHRRVADSPLLRGCDRQHPLPGAALRARFHLDERDGGAA